MNKYLQVIFLSSIGGVFSLIGGVIMLSRKKLADNLAQYATPFAAGALLGAVFLDLLKDGLEEASANTVLMGALIGFLLFFFAERFLHWFHHHHMHEHPEDKDITTKPLVIIGDTIHNAMDGVAIAAAFIANPAAGIVTTIAVAAHEIPQEIGDFGLLLSKGMSRKKVLIVNIVSALAATAAAVITLALGNADMLPVGFMLGLSSGFLLYIAASDIIPDIHEQAPTHKLFEWRAMLLLAGVIVVGASIYIAHHFIEG
jgi:zinc and cadmium transporter